MQTGEFGKCGEFGEFGETGEASEKLEWCFVDSQRFDAMIKRGWWNAKPHSGPRAPSDAASGCGERRFDDLPFVAGIALRWRR